MTSFVRSGSALFNSIFNNSARINFCFPFFPFIFSVLKKVWCFKFLLCAGEFGVSFIGAASAIEIHNIALAENILNRKMLLPFSQLFHEAGCLQREHNDRKHVLPLFAKFFSIPCSHQRRSCFLTAEP